MQSFKNVTAVTEGLNEDGTLYLLHQIGLLYQVNDVAPLKNQCAEMEHDWIDPQKLPEASISPFVKISIE
jgi:hypothetical protein